MTSITLESLWLRFFHTLAGGTLPRGSRLYKSHGQVLDRDVEGTSQSQTYDEEHLTEE